MTAPTLGARPDAQPGAVTIVEVAPRDGLQADPADLTTDQKVELVLRAVRAGIRRVEVASFVNPKRVPKMADAEAVVAALREDPTMRDRGASTIGLVLNAAGFDRARDAGVDEVNAVVVCTDTFAHKNQGRDTAGLIEVATEVCRSAREAAIPVSVTLAATFGCPYEGEVSLDRLAWVLEEVAAAGPDEIALADSIGVASPLDVRERIRLATDVIGERPVRLRAHFHNTRNTGLANAVAAVEVGVGVLDSSLGGVGGCPFAPGATGNIPTEDLVYLLHRMGYTTGIDLRALAAEVAWVEEALGHGVPGALAKAGLFPAASFS